MPETPISALHVKFGHALEDARRKKGFATQRALVDALEKERLPIIEGRISGYERGTKVIPENDLIVLITALEMDDPVVHDMQTWNKANPNYRRPRTYAAGPAPHRGIGPIETWIAENQRGQQFYYPSEIDALRAVARAARVTISKSERTLTGELEI